MYATPEEVREFTGVQPGDLGLTSPEELDTLLADWSEDVRDMIDRDRGRDFLAEAGGILADVPRVVRSVAKRAMANYVQLARNSRESAIVRVDEWRVAFEQKSQVLTPDLRAELARAFGTRGRFRGFVARAKEEEATGG